MLKKNILGVVNDHDVIFSYYFESKFVAHGQIFRNNLKNTLT